LIDEGASVGVVTNNFHVFRALQIAKSQGLTNICGIATKTTPLYLPNNMVREYFGELKYLIKSL
ncbi:MAG: YdcF family protein, partial [Lachnospiraceae bacterium]